MLAGHHPADDWAALDSARYYAAARLGTRGWHVGERDAGSSSP